MAEHIVEFHKYCPNCKYKDLVENPSDWDADPYNICNECMSEPVNEDSRKPIYFTPEDKE